MLSSGKIYGRILVATILAVLSHAVASAQETDDYMRYKIDADEEARVAVESDTLLFYRAVQQSRDLFDEIAAYRFSNMAFARRGMSYTERTAALDGIEVRLGTAFEDFVRKDETSDVYVTRDGQRSFGKVLYTGMIDAFFGYCEGALEYRSLEFQTELLEVEDNYQGNAVVNYTEREIPFTRIIEHKHFEFGHQPDTVITREYPREWKRGDEPYYPVNDERNAALYRPKKG